MEVQGWAAQIKGFSKLPYTDKILALGYYLHIERKIDHFYAPVINGLFDQLHIDRPTNTSSQMLAMSKTKPKRLLFDSKGCRLAIDERAKVASWLPAVQTPKQIIAELKALEAQITDPQQKVFLHEALVCFSHEAYRASIVMTWNLAYHHVLTFVFNHNLAEFNAYLKSQFPKENLVIKLFTDFEEIREGKVIVVIKGAGIVTAATAKTLKAKLDIRNTSAHPSSTIVAPVTAEEVITDLLKNILLRAVL